MAWSIAIILSAGILIWFFSERLIATDFSVYWRTANEPVWAAYIDRDQLPFPYAPTMLLWLWPLHGSNPYVAYAIWASFTAIVFVLACSKHLTFKQTLLATISPVVINNIGTGQVSTALAAALLFACGLNNRIAAGIIFGIVAGIKPQLVLMAPFFLLRRRDWKALLAAAIMFAGQIAATLMLFGTSIWEAWIKSLAQFHYVLKDQNVLSVGVTPASFAEHWGLPSLPFLIAGVIGGLWVSTRAWRSDPVRDCALIVSASLLAAPYALVYDLSALIPYLVVGVYAGSVACAVAIAGTINPAPLLITAVRLFRSTYHPEKNRVATERAALPAE